MRLLFTVLRRHSYTQLTLLCCVIMSDVVSCTSRCPCSVVATVHFLTSLFMKQFTSTNYIFILWNINVTFCPSYVYVAGQKTRLCVAWNVSLSTQHDALHQRFPKFFGPPPPSLPYTHPQRPPIFF
jgi:cell division protein FtsL